MKWLKYVLWTLFAGIAFYYLIILGGPIRNLIELRGCTVSYTHYLTNNAYCNWVAAHCETNETILASARGEVARCLCENAPQNKLEARELLDLIHADPVLNNIFTRLEAERGVPLDSVQEICDYRKTLFEPLWSE